MGVDVVGDSEGAEVVGEVVGTEVVGESVGDIVGLVVVLVGH